MGRVDGWGQFGWDVVASCGRCSRSVMEGEGDSRRGEYEKVSLHEGEVGGERSWGWDGTDDVGLDE